MSPELPDDVVAAARQGDPTAVEAVLRAHLDVVHAVCRRMCRDPGDAEDATQEALLAIARGLPRFDGRSAVSTWAYRVTVNACTDQLRRARRRPAPVPPDATRLDRGGPAAGPAPPEERVEAAEVRRRIADALAGIPEDQRAAVVLRDVADLDYAAIAEALGIPAGTVRSRIARGRAALADALADLRAPTPAPPRPNPPGTDAPAPSSKGPVR